MFDAPVPNMTRAPAGPGGPGCPQACFRMARRLLYPSPIAMNRRTAMSSAQVRPPIEHRPSRRAHPRKRLFCGAHENPGAEDPACIAATTISSAASGSPREGGYFDNSRRPPASDLPDRALASRRRRARHRRGARGGAGVGSTPVAERSRDPERIADRMEQYLPVPRAVETYDNGKPIRETYLADLPLAVDHFRYFASCIRAAGRLARRDSTTTLWPITSMSRSASSARSFPGTSRC